MRSDLVFADVASVWKVTIARHITRRAFYKGKKVDLEAQDVKLAFDGFTLPGLFFVAP